MAFPVGLNSSLGDCRDLLTGTYDRIVMGHFDAISMLPSALLHVHEGSIIHLHSIGTVEDRDKRAGRGQQVFLHLFTYIKSRNTAHMPGTWCRT